MSRRYCVLTSCNKRLDKRSYSYKHCSYQCWKELDDRWQALRVRLVRKDGPPRTLLEGEPDGQGIKWKW